MKYEAVFAGIITAAGYSSRMGGLKPLLPFGNSTMLGKAITTMHEAGINDVVVVGGYRYGDVAKASASHDVICINNTAFNEGMISSVKAGLDFFASRARLLPDAFFLLPVDAALVDARTISYIAQYWRNLYGGGLSAKDAVIFPCMEGKQGHPPLIGISHLPMILKWSGNGGLQGYLQDFADNNPDKVHFLKIDDPGILSDLDTVPEYLEACSRYFCPNVHTTISPKLYLMRHGHLESLMAKNGEKAYVGRFDIPMSEQGIKQIQSCAKYISGELALPPIILHSPAKRSEQSAKEVARAFGENASVPVCVQGLAEVSLGSWEGLGKSEVMNKFPHTFALRGENFLTTRPENGENLLDVAARLENVVKELKCIQAKGHDVVISGHQTMLAVFIAILLELPLECCVKMRIDYGGLSILRFTDGRYCLKKFNFVP